MNKLLLVAWAVSMTAFAVVQDRASFGPLTPSAQPYEREYIWPKGKMPHPQAHQSAEKSAVKQAKGYDAAAHRGAFIEWYAPATSNKTDVCVLVISGGGFYQCCDAERLQPAIDRFVANGYTVANLTYRTPRPEGLPIHQSAWEDAQRAVRVARNAAAKRGFDPAKIGGTGISAGAKTLLLLATSSETRAYEPVDAIDELPCNLMFAIPQASAYVLSDGAAGQNTRGGEGADITILPELKFDAHTCPMCLFHGGDDKISPIGSARVYERLRMMHIPAELHIFADRWHGFHGDMNRGDDATAWDHWFNRALEFMRQMNYDGRLGKSQDIMQRFKLLQPELSFRAKQNVWPEGKMPNVQEQQSTPYIEWFIPKDLRTHAIQIIFSGGGYNHTKPTGGAVEPARRFLNSKGMAVVVMDYRTPRPKGLPKHLTAFQDLQRAIRLVRAQAQEHGLDPNRIGVMGGSAGGHLALLGAVSSFVQSYQPFDKYDELPCNVQWAVAIYPAYVLSDGFNGPNKKGGNGAELTLAPEFKFDTVSCPVLFVHGDADGYSPMGSVRCWEKLRNMGIQCDLHTLATRPHSFLINAAPGTGSWTYLERIWEFLNHKELNK